MCSNDVKLIQYDFDGATFRDKGTRKQLAEMVRKAEGESIIAKR